MNEKKIKIKRKTTAIKTCQFYIDAEKYRTKAVDENEIFKINYTTTFFRELDIMIQNEEIIVGNINAKMRLGKSTTGIALGFHTIQRMKYYKQLPSNYVYSMANIARDQHEKLRMMTNPDTSFTCITTDESNELEEGGENSSAEKALAKVMSDVHAGRYVHSWSCSPKEVIDPNADILLSVVGMDKTNKINRCKMYYRYYEGEYDTVQLLGHVDIPVGHIINRWLDVKNIFYKKVRTKKEQNILDKAIKEDFYCEYMVKKYEKMELTTKHGIMRPRVMEYANVIMKTITKLTPMTKYKMILNDKTIKNIIKIEMQKAKIPTSIVGITLAKEEASGVLENYKSFYEFKKLMEINKIKQSKAKNTMQLNDLKEEYKNMKELQESLYEVINYQIEEYHNMIELNKRYNTHINDGVINDAI